MRKNKKLLMFLALNSLATSFAGTTINHGATKHDKLYNNVAKNIETGKSNENHKLIQDVLDKKNQEFKNLYTQENYAEKPESLEWQIFFNSFYNKKNKGDNTAENAKYYSNPKKSNGNSTLYDDETIYGDTPADGHFKPYKPIQEPEFIDPFVNPDGKDTTKDMSDINVLDINISGINSSVVSFREPSSLSTPTIDLTGFNPSVPNITTMNFGTVPTLNLVKTPIWYAQNDGITGFFPYGDENGESSIISQMDLTSGTITVKTGVNPDNPDYNAPGYYSYTLDNVIGAPSAGLTYDNSSITNGPAVLPTGVYSDSILNDPSGNYSSVQGIIEVVDNPITRIGIKGSNPDDLKITLEGDVPDTQFLEQILYYDEQYNDWDPNIGERKNYTLDDMETKGWITSAEKSELAAKFLDTTFGYTTENRYFQYVENNGTWNLKGSNVAGVDLHDRSGGFTGIFMNRGDITGLNEASSTNNLIGEQAAFMFISAERQGLQDGIDNTGKVEMRAPESIGYLLADAFQDDSYLYVDMQDSRKRFIYNEGEIKLYGNNNIGVDTHNAPLMSIFSEESRYSDGSSYEYSSFVHGLLKTEIKLFNPLTVLGDQSIGVDIERELNFADSKIKVNVGTEDPRQAVTSITGVNGLENSGNITGGNALYTDGSAGIYINMAGNIVDNNVHIYDEINPDNNADIYTSGTESLQFTLNDYLLNVGSYSRGGAGLRVEDAGDVILGASTDSTTTHEINLLAGGKNNVGIYIIGTDSIVTTDGLNLNIDGSEQVGVQIGPKGTFYHKNGNINVNGTDNTGIVAFGGYGELSGTANINVAAENLGVYNAGAFYMTGGKITANGKAAVGVYSAPSNAYANLSGGTVRAENGGIGLYSDKNSTINLGGNIKLQAGNKGLLFYNYDDAGVAGKYNLTGSIETTVEKGGNVFYIRKGQSITDYLTNSFTGLGNLDLTMQSGSKLYILDGKGSTMNLTAIDSMGTSLTPNVSISSASASDFIPLSMDKGTLVLDRNINLDDSSDVYNRSEFISASVNVNDGVTLAGTQNDQIGTAQKNYVGTTGINEVTLNNMGTISQSGANSVGLAADFGHIINNNKIQITGNNGIGIVSANGTQTENNGEIVIGGTDTAGIYGLNYFNGATSSSVLGYGNDGINILNNGKITSQGVGKVYGIYAANTAGAASTVTLGSGSDIDLRSSNGGVGVYADKTTVNLNAGSSLKIGDNNGTGVYAVNGSNVVNNGITSIGNGSYGYVLKSGSNLVNNTAATLGENGVLVYGDGAGTITNNGQLTMTGSNNVGIYTSNGGTIKNTADIAGSAGQANMGIYNEAGSINNTGNISVGDSIITDSTKNSYAIGIYGDRSAVENHGNIAIGANGVGIYTKNTPITAPTKNFGNISSNSNGAIGLFAEHSNLENYGDITLGGKNSIGIYGNKESNILNKGTITLNNDNSTGVLLNSASTLDNQGTINVNGNNSNAVLLKDGSTIVNRGTLNIAGGVTGSSDITYVGAAPSIVNSGIMTTSESFEAKGINVSIKVDPATVAAKAGEAVLISDAVKFYAPSFNTTDPIEILSGFTTGTHAQTYKFENVFNLTTEDKSGLAKVKSKSLTWKATPFMNSQGNIDVWMEKIPYDNFTNGLWYEDFGKALDGKYVGTTGNAGKIFDKIDSIEQESDFRKTMGSLAGDVYANMNQREATIIDAFDSSLNMLQDSTNNIKENVKINVITGKGSLTENTDGVLGYDYETIGALALREIERTERQTLGFSLGYLHTGFEFNDGNDSEEQVDAIQLGAHSKYQLNDWVLRNDLMGRASIHNVDRNIDWSNAGRSQMNGSYESYSITSDNNLGKEISLGKNASVTPYGGLEATYVVRPSFTEDGLESLEVKGNDAWSVKPKLGVELKAETNESKKGWKVKGTLDLAYEYELADMNEREYARLTAIEDDYHKLSKPQNDKGTVTTKAAIGAEIENKYGIYLTGDYSLGEKDQDEYRVGVTLKAVF